MNDLYFEYNNKAFQIDSLLFIRNCIYHFELKNFRGELFFRDDELFNSREKEIDNPTIQLERGHKLLRRMLNNYGFSFPIKSYVVFINSECTIYLPHRINHFLLPTQINSFFSNLISESTVNPQHKLVIQKLLELHLTDPPMQKLPSYTYNELRKGINCITCGSFWIKINKNYSYCQNCKNQVLTSNLILNNVREFQHLFPKQKLTTSRIKDWCDDHSSNRIQRILNRYYTKKGEKKGAFYE